MKKHINKICCVFLIVVFASALLITAYAHPGRTDSNGGHYDRSTGKYHYHHGYSAHQHTNGECPYDFDNNEKPNSNTNNATTSNNNNNSNNKKGFAFSDIVVVMLVGIIILFWGGLGCIVIMGIGYQIYEKINTAKENAKLRDKLMSHKNIKYKIFPIKKQNKFLTEQWLQIEKEKIIKELRNQDLLKIKDKFPEDIILLKNFELKFTQESYNTPFGKYTVYIEYGERILLHKEPYCGSLSKRENKLSLNYAIDSCYTLCEKCWQSTKKQDYPDLFMPEWYRPYKEVKDKMTKYNISIEEISS